MVYLFSTVLAFQAGGQLIEAPQRSVTDPRNADLNARYERADDAKAMEILWKSLDKGRERPAPVPAVDFEKWTVVLLMPSAREADRHRMSFGGAELQRGILIIRYSLMAIPLDGGPGLHLPYQLLKVPRTDGPIRVVQGTQDAGTGKVADEK